MTEFTALMESVTRDGAAWQVDVTPDWKQGRTLYGGLSAALCAQAALNEWPDLPPLRSASFSFIGPAEGVLRMTPALLRRGKSTVFAGVDLVGDGGLATRAVMCFGAARDSALRHHGLPMPAVKPPDECPDFFRHSPAMLSFLQHIDGRFAGGALPFRSGDEPGFTLWLRHRDPALAQTVAALLALADAPPPPTAAIIKAPPKAISTMTWTVDFLTDDATSPDGWWLNRLDAEAAADGYAAHTALLWASDGRPVIAARQNVAIF